VAAVSVTAAQGFSAAGTSCGIKPGRRPDLAIVAANRPVSAAGVFTTSSTAAPPVLVSRQHLANGLAQVIVINSGCANAGTGARGYAAATTTALAAAAAYGCEASDVLVCSTGTIGPQLPVGRLIKGLPRQLGVDREAGTAAAVAIMTTDTVEKESALSVGGYTIGGMTKGAGMIRPDMATMLAVITTDAIVPAAKLQRSLQEAVDLSFNSLNIDGCQSTNDSVLMLASGESGIAPDFETFSTTLASVCGDLAHQIVADAEGASRVVTLRVVGATSESEARSIGKFVTDSDLVRCSFYGGDPNWGRIFGALGACPGNIDPDSVSISFGGVRVADRGVGVDFNEGGLASALAAGDFTVEVTVGNGPGRATVLTTDLTPDYVRFNGERS
jgi:glutamate N-acetyltransferase/amino-acid N-acetyltransferase